MANSSIIFIYGHAPRLSYAEIAACLKNTNLIDHDYFASANINEAPDIDEFGSIPKMARVGHNWPLENLSPGTINKSLSELIGTQIDGKITLGLSFYGPFTNHEIHQLRIICQQYFKNRGNSIRLILPTDKSAKALPAASLYHNKLLTNNPKKFELVIVKNKANQCYIGKTIAVQDAQKYSIRDFNKPARDPKNGMLPPKLAKTMINLARWSLPPHEKANRQLRLLDPFCGSGTVLIEAELLGMQAYGTDLNPRMIDDSRNNLAWLNAAQDFKLETADATNHHWIEPIDLVVTEMYLGQPFANRPSANDLKHNVNICNQLLTDFLRNLSTQLELGATICLAAPTWMSTHTHLPVLDNIPSSFRLLIKPITYSRPGQQVGRDILVLQKSK